MSSDKNHLDYKNYGYDSALGSIRNNTEEESTNQSQINNFVN